MIGSSVRPFISSRSCWNVIVFKYLGVIKGLILPTSCEFEPFTSVVNTSCVRWWASCLFNDHLLDLQIEFRCVFERWLSKDLSWLHIVVHRKDSWFAECWFCLRQFSGVAFGQLLGLCLRKLSVVFASCVYFDGGLGSFVCRYVWWCVNCKVLTRLAHIIIILSCSVRYLLFRFVAILHCKPSFLHWFLGLGLVLGMQNSIGCHGRRRVS